MPSIDIDFEVFKALTARRETEEMTENDVLRSLLDLSPLHTKSSSPAHSANGTGIPWIAKGVSFPHGTEFRAAYKGQQFTGVVKNGALVINGKRYKSPSAAAYSITGSGVNGWRFWECLLPGSTKWKVMASYRR